MLTRRRLLAALAGIPGGAAISKLWKPKPDIPGFPEEFASGKEFHVFKGEMKPRVVTCAENFLGYDGSIVIAGEELPRSMVILFPSEKPGGDAVAVLLDRAFLKHPDPERHAYWAHRIDHSDSPPSRRVVLDGEKAILMGLAQYIFWSEPAQFRYHPEA